MEYIGKLYPVKPHSDFTVIQLDFLSIRHEYTYNIDYQISIAKDMLSQYFLGLRRFDAYLLPYVHYNNSIFYLGTGNTIFDFTEKISRVIRKDKVPTDDKFYKELGQLRKKYMNILEELE